MNSNLIFVTGPFGASVMERSRALSVAKGFPFICLDDEIEKADGRSVLRICMIMGEHEYRNKEYEALKNIEINYRTAVIACGDGVLLDEMSREIILKHKLIIEGYDLTEDELFEAALKINNPCHAFMYDTNKEQIRKAFTDLYIRQHAFFKEYL